MVYPEVRKLIFLPLCSVLLTVRARSHRSLQSPRPPPSPPPEANLYNHLVNCVRGTKTQPLIFLGCSVYYLVSCAINKRGYFEITFLSTHICLSLKCLLTFYLTLTRANSRGVSCVLGVHLSKVC